MKYLKEYKLLELNTYNSYKIVIRERFDHIDELFIIVDENKNLRNIGWIKAFKIGFICNNRGDNRHTRLIFNREDNWTSIRIDTCKDLSKEDKEVVLKEIIKYNDDSYYVKTYLDIIKAKTGFDIYNDWSLYDNINKYNL